MRVSYQLFKVVMRSIKTSLGGWSGDVQFISQGRGFRIYSLNNSQQYDPLPSYKPPALYRLIRTSGFLAVSHVNNIGSPLLGPQHREVALIARLTAWFKYD